MNLNSPFTTRSPIKLSLSLVGTLLVSQVPAHATRIVEYAFEGQFVFAEYPNAMTAVWDPISSDSGAIGQQFNGQLRFRYPQTDLRPDDSSVGLYRDTGTSNPLTFTVTHPENGASETFSLEGTLESRFVQGGPFTIQLTDTSLDLTGAFSFENYGGSTPEEGFFQLPESTSPEFLLNLDRYAGNFFLSNSLSGADALRAYTDVGFLTFSKPTIASVPDTGSSMALLALASSVLAFAATAIRRQHSR